MQQKWLRDGQCSSPFTTIRRMLHYASTVAMSETSLPRIEFNAAGTHCSVNGKSIPLDAPPKLYAGLVSEGRELFSELTAGHSTDLPFVLSDLQDNKLKDAPDYGFLNSTNEDLQSVRMRNIQWLMSTGYLSVRNGQKVWDKVKMAKWFKKAHQLNQIIMVLMHIGGGQPARGQELFTLTFRNQQNVHRTLFVGHGNLCWILGYSKVSFLISSSIFSL